MMARNIHSDIDPKLWARVYAGTELWPEENRSMQSICRYAMNELWVGLYATDPEDAADIVSPFPSVKGKHLQAKSSTDEEAQRWADLEAEYGSLSEAIRVALAQLLSAFESNE